MMSWQDYEMKREQYQDRLREAEKERLLKQLMADRGKSGLWQSIGDFVSDMGKGKSTAGKLDSGQVCCAEEAA